MRWDHVLESVVRRMRNDSALTEIYGSALRKAGVHKFVTPSLDYFLVTFNQNELWEPTIIQFNQWTRSMEDLARSDRRLRRLFDHDEMVVIEGVTMWAQFEDGGDLTGPETEGFYGLASRYRFTPVRERLLYRDAPPVYETVERLEDSLVATAGNYLGWGGNNAGRLKIGWDVQTEPGAVGSLHKIVAFLRGSSPTQAVGEVRAQLCALVGDHETNAVPGAVLATSEPIDASTFNTSIQPVPERVEFNFVGSQRISLSPEARYMIVLDGLGVTNVGLVADTGANEFWSKHYWNGTSWSRSFFRNIAFELWSADTQVVVP